MVNEEDILDFIISVFEAGLNEDSHYRSLHYADLNVDRIKEYLKKCEKDSLEQLLLTKVIEDFDSKGD